MKRSELLTRLLITATLLGVVGTPLVAWARTPLVHARLAEDGGWSPGVIRAEAGQPLHLRLTSDDVVHGFAVGQMDAPSVDVLPGKVTDVTLIFDEPGTYTFYCTRWCGVNHWRMRGTIEVGGSASDPQPAAAPLYVTLGLDIDAPHDALVIPSDRPSAIRGEQLAANLPVFQFINSNFYRANSPYQLFQDLDSTYLSNSEKWDVVAYVWESNVSSEALANGQRLYAQNCAACHGENGAGDGVFADRVALNFGKGMSSANNGRPIAFTNSETMLGASPALLQGKILRGGMGTGMPMWGSIFTEGRIWDLVAYLYSFQFVYP